MKLTIERINDLAFNGNTKGFKPLHEDTQDFFDHFGKKANVRGYLVKGLTKFVKERYGLECTGFSFGFHGIYLIDADNLKYAEECDIFHRDWLVAHELGHLAIWLPHRYDSDLIIMNPGACLGFLQTFRSMATCIIPERKRFLRIYYWNSFRFRCFTWLHKLLTKIPKFDMVLYNQRSGT